MKMIFLFSFLLALCKGSILIAVGILLRKHFHPFISMIMRRPLPENLISHHDYTDTLDIVRIIGLFIILIGIGTIVISLLTSMQGFAMPGTGLNFNF